MLTWGGFLCYFGRDEFLSIGGSNGKNGKKSFAVTHRRFGPGQVPGCERGVLQVYFDQYGMHYFRYPQAFDSRQLTPEDPDLLPLLERHAAASEK